jgi:hypothetical protein
MGMCRTGCSRWWKHWRPPRTTNNMIHFDRQPPRVGSASANPLAEGNTSGSPLGGGRTHCAPTGPCFKTRGGQRTTDHGGPPPTPTPPPPRTPPRPPHPAPRSAPRSAPRPPGEQDCRNVVFGHLLAKCCQRGTSSHQRSAAARSPLGGERTHCGPPGPALERGADRRPAPCPAPRPAPRGTFRNCFRHRLL